MEKRLTVADFFCGAGGFSEGFRQAGFDIRVAVDNWAPAQKTHKLNHPNCNHPGLDCHLETKGDILNIPTEEINKIIEDVDVIIGSPPCVSFSTSNKAGNADKSLGIKLIEKYLQIIAVKKHKPNSTLKYWLLENVPNSRFHIKEEYSFKDLGLNNLKLKKLKISKKEKDIALKLNISEENIFNSAHFGIPQKRNRFICGEFPFPNKITPDEINQTTLKTVLSKLKPSNKSISDPNYDLSIKLSEVTDHNYSTIIHPFEWNEAKLKKQQARFYGRMAFPENLDKPSRTVMATKSTVSRESIILPGSKKNEYRSPTIREVASIMSFPITYLFQGINETTKYKLVGNAVCPKLSFEFAKAIKNKKIIKPKIQKINPSKLETDLSKIKPQNKSPKNKSPDSNFAEIIPDLKINNFRVELDNNFPKKTGKLKWNATLHHGTGKKDMKQFNLTLRELKKIIKEHNLDIDLKKIELELNKTIFSSLPDSNTFQKQYCAVIKYKNYLTPLQLLQNIKKSIDIHFPNNKYCNTHIYAKLQNKTQKIHIPLRVLVGFYLLKYSTEIIKNN